MFFHQLRQLLRKNLLIRSRSKKRLVAEIVWPLALSIVLVLIRTRVLNVPLTECFLDEKAFPSAGSLRYFQSLLCTSFNWCYDSPQPPVQYDDHANELVSALEDVLTKRNKKRDYNGPINDSNGLSGEKTHGFRIISSVAPGRTNDSQWDFFEEDISTLESLSVFLGKVDRSIFGRLATLLARRASKNKTSLEDAARMVCGKEISLPLQWPAMIPSLQSHPINQRRKIKQPKTEVGTSQTISTEAESGLPEKCRQLFSTLTNSKSGQFIYKSFYPFVRGKIVYAPNTPPFNTLVQRVNRTFQDLQEAQDIANKWLNVLSPNITIILTRLDQLIPNAVALVNSKCPLVLPNCQEEAGKLHQLAEKISSMRSTVKQLDSLADFANSFFECYDFDKFIGLPDEPEAVNYGMKLLGEDQLWAVVIFDKGKNGTNSTSTDIPSHVTYKIRMDKFVVDDTTKLKESGENPWPRNDPRRGRTKYFTSGFIYLQDKIERAIVQMHSKREQDLPEIYAEQIPSPCNNVERFLHGIGPHIPLFMNLSFVFACAVIVKSIVYEKEKRLKETMRTMGLSNIVQWVAWFIDSISISLPGCILLSLILYYGGIYDKSDPTVVMALLLSSSVATITFSFLISTFFTRANEAAAWGAFIFFITFQPFHLLQFSGSPTLVTYIFLSLISNVAFGVGNAYIIDFEIKGDGAQWYNIATSLTMGDSFSLLGCILMQLVDAVIYMVLTFYIEAVFPGMYGVPKPWNFLFQRSFWSQDNQSHYGHDYVEMESRTTRDLIEVEPSGLPVGVSIRNLEKSFSNGKPVIRNLNLEFYQNQITSFLGHNGAGKTTTISILTGLFPPTSGTAVINGFDIRYQMDDIRQQLGICPQFNVLFDQLTVIEHLVFYANLKMGNQISMAEIDQVIEDLGLSHKRNEMSCHLSGGMKRKLSIGAAFIGNSRTVILDEPTAGVDPYSRRSIWEILLKYKAGRTIILTTHFMDEADLLGDRIAIISQGQLKCCGSSLFLKQKLGSGYHLTLVRKEPGSLPERSIASSAVIMDILNRHVANHFIVQDAGSDLVICLPEFDGDGAGQRHKFAQLFKELESRMDDAGLASYGVSDTTLEDVFLKVANDDSSTAESTSSQETLHTGLDIPSADSAHTVIRKLTGTAFIFQHVTALLMKRFYNSRRNLKGLFCEVFLSVLLVIIGEVVISSLNSSPPPLVLTPWLYGNSTVSFFANRNPGDRSTNEYVRNMLNGTGMSIRCTADGLLRFEGNCSLSALGLLNPGVSAAEYDDIRCPCRSGVPVCPSNISQTGLWKYGSVTGDEFYDLSENDVRFWTIRTHKEFKNRIGGFEVGVHRHEADVVPRNASDSNVKIWFDNNAWASSVTLLNSANNIILRSSIPPSEDPYQYGITAVNHPLDFSSQNNHNLDRMTSEISFAIIVVFGLSFVPASFAVFLVEERVSKVKLVQFVSGVKPLTFWIAAYVWDLMIYCIPCIFIIIVLICFGKSEYVSSQSIGGILLLLFLFGVSAIPLMYQASLIFSVPSTAFVSLASINLFIGTVTTIASFVLHMFNDEVLETIANVMDVVFLIFPHFCLGRGMIDMAQEYNNQVYHKIIGADYELNIFDWNYLGRYFTCMIAQAIIFFIITLMLHYSSSSCMKKSCLKMEALPLKTEDEDVARERERVETGRTSEDQLRLVGLSKIYGRRKTPAADRLSFGVKRGECFGLLGVNGAGKSTTFKMLTGEEAVTDGNAFLSGFSIVSQLSKARQHLGYCPQEDALFPRLTGEEHLELFARLRGIPKHLLKAMVENSLKNFGLLPYAKRTSETYSGGNKRKLATAIALIGDPAMVLLDEPSSGMDPKASRLLWQNITNVVKDSRSVLVTSHSMEECQVLCTRLAIMVDGTLRCLGSPQHLKNRFGDGYTVNVRCDMEKRDEVRLTVQDAIPEAHLREQRPRQLIWHVSHDILPVSVLFSRMEAAREENSSLLDYSITQTTLDDVFVRFARLQGEVLTNETGSDPPEMTYL